MSIKKKDSDYIDMMFKIDKKTAAFYDELFKVLGEAIDLWEEGEFKRRESNNPKGLFIKYVEIESKDGLRQYIFDLLKIYRGLEKKGK